MASAKAASSTSPPAALLMIRQPGLTRARVSALSRLAVSGVNGTCMVMKSARSSNSVKSTGSAPYMRMVSAER